MSNSKVATCKAGRCGSRLGIWGVIYRCAEGVIEPFVFASVRLSVCCSLLLIFLFVFKIKSLKPSHEIEVKTCLLLPSTTLNDTSATVIAQFNLTSSLTTAVYTLLSTCNPSSEEH